jgi:hypothetical protein
MGQERDVFQNVDPRSWPQIALTEKNRNLVIV